MAETPARDRSIFNGAIFNGLTRMLPTLHRFAKRSFENAVRFFDSERVIAFENVRSGRI